MRTLLLLGCLLTGAWLMATPAPVVELTPDTEAMLSDEAMARYAEPGSVRRYKKLIESLRKPPEEIGSPARNLRLPVRSYPNGRPQTTVQAEEAWITLDTNYLRGRNVHVEQLDENGAVEAVLEADEIVVDRGAMLAVVKGRVRGEMGGDILTGVGALVDLDTRYLRIVRRARINTKRMGDVKLTDRGIF